MVKGNPPEESAPPYPGPPQNYDPPHPQVFPQPGENPKPSPYPPPPGFNQPGDPYPPPQPVISTTTTTVTQVIVSQSLRDAPGEVVCPHCHKNVITDTQYVDGFLTWLSCVSLGTIGCCLCCFIPYCLDPCKDVEHRCPKCKQFIYLYKRILN